ncbi:cell division protein FtsK [Rhizobium sp. Leaf453]|nr:cell division protein FtsK [Rhizobium sp. Leaf386]KQS89102.1 cell division protein FtsK [Rhizobium sp. Leaf391]KQT92951.1 cell division protein FtsK [Rhizobium sp. Leaf453]
MEVSSHTGADTDAMAASEIEGRDDAPVWQSAFVLGPNVRFTRTPESVYSKRPGSGQKEEPAALVTSVEEQPEVVEAAPTPEAPAIDDAMPAYGIQALSLRLMREMSAVAAARMEKTIPGYQPPASADVDLACFPTEQTAIEEPVNSAAPMAVEPQPVFSFHVSDQVFWDAMDMDADLDVLAPTVSWKAPEVEIAANSVTALYREIGIRPAGASAGTIPAPKLSLPTAPVLKAPIRAAREVKSSASAPATARPALQPKPPVVPALAAPILPATVLPTPTLPVPAVVATPVQIQTPLPVARIETPAMITEAHLAISDGEYVFPPVDLLQEPGFQETTIITQEALEQSAGLLESVLEDFGVRGEIIDVRPGPVVTLYEFEPAPGVKSSRVIGLSDDIARSMSALSARVAVVPGRNVIGIELPNPVRETVYFRELIESENYGETRFKLALCLGKTIGGEPVVAELAKMPHLLVAGTTGSGKSVAINTMILSLLYRLKPEECRLIMVDPKMLELSVYDGIPHLLTPVVTDPKKAVMALKWAVREMEDRYRKMSRLGVRNIDGFNARAATARAKGETILCSVQTGFDRSTGEPVYEQEEMDLAPMPYIVIIVDEMADLMMVAGKEIEGAIQRLAQMARAAGIHLIMATQRPSVDVITGTIKANFPTRISFQVTSKIDSRTILGEQGAEHLLGQGDMLHMVGGGRIARVHGPFVSDEEVEKVVAHLKTQGRPEYLGTVTEDAEEAEEAVEEDGAVFDKGSMAEEDGNDLYDKAVKVVLRDKKCSTSYIQRRLSIGYNKAASLVERMEREGLVGAANHVGKRAILSGGRESVELPVGDDE